jgi:hypothetical protein
MFDQIFLSTSEADRAAARIMLIDIYFQLFHYVVGKRVPEQKTSKSGEKRKKHKEPSTRSHGCKSKQLRDGAGFAEVEDENAKLLAGINCALSYAHFKSENDNQIVVGWPDRRRKGRRCIEDKKGHI